jgi:hypothetical protein
MHRSQKTTPDQQKVEMNFRKGWAGVSWNSWRRFSRISLPEDARRDHNKVRSFIRQRRAHFRDLALVWISDTPNCRPIMNIDYERHNHVEHNQTPHSKASIPKESVDHEPPFISPLVRLSNRITAVRPSPECIHHPLHRGCLRFFTFTQCFDLRAWYGRSRAFDTMNQPR